MPRKHTDNCGRTGKATMASCKLDCDCWCHKVPNTISRMELAKLTYVNSDDIPKAVVIMRPRRMEWVGIGWIDCGEPRGNETVVTDEPRKTKRKA